jgi:hypothetical protein
MPPIARCTYRCLLLVTIFAAVGSTLWAQNLDVLVAGVAVYHDVPDGPEYRAAATELILVGGAFSGPQFFVPVSKLDFDLTASINNGYEKQDEGIFHLLGPKALDPKNSKAAVSIVHSMRSSNPNQNAPPSPRFFSHAFYPKVQNAPSRGSVKVWLELWPTIRTVQTGGQLVYVLLGIIQVRTAPAVYDDQKTQKELLLEELRMLSALLPKDRNARAALLDEARKLMQPFLTPQVQALLRQLEIDVFEVLSVVDDDVMKLLDREERYWAAFRAIRPAVRDLLKFPEVLK